jgi:hypothetical protein
MQSAEERPPLGVVKAQRNMGFALRPRCSRGVFLAQSEFFSRFPAISMIDEAVCGRLRAFEPRTAHEHALLAQLPEFYSREPSRSNLRSIAERVLSSTEEENRSLGRGVNSEALSYGHSIRRRAER